MALDPRISLAVQPPNIQPPDLLKTMLASAQMRESATLSASRLQQIQEVQAELVRQERQRELMRRWADEDRGVAPGQGAAYGPSILQRELGTPSPAQVPVVRQTEFRPTVTSPITSEPGFAGAVRTGEDAVGVRTAEPVRLPEQPLTQTTQPVAAPPVSQPAAPEQQVAVAPTTATDAQPAAATAPLPSAQVAPLPGMRMQPRTATQRAYAILGNGANNALQVVQGLDAAENAEVNRQTARLQQAVTGLDYIQRASGGVNSQATLDAVHADIESKAPGAGAVLPPTYTPESWAQFQQGLKTQEQLHREALLEIQKGNLKVAQTGAQTQQRQADIHQQQVEQQGRTVQATVADKAVDVARNMHPFVTDQRTLDMYVNAVRELSPQLAETLPKTYTKEAIDELGTRLKKTGARTTLDEGGFNLMYAYDEKAKKYRVLQPTRGGVLREMELQLRPGERLLGPGELPPAGATEEKPTGTPATPPTAGQVPQGTATTPPAGQARADASQIQIQPKGIVKETDTEILTYDQTGTRILKREPKNVGQAAAERASGTEQGKQEAERGPKARQAKLLLDQLDIKNARMYAAMTELAEIAKNSPNSFGRLYGAWENVNDPTALRIRSAIKTLNANIGLEELENLKAMGLTLGQVTEPEHRLLREQVADLEPRLPSADFSKKVATIWETIHKYQGLRQNAFQMDFPEGAKQRPPPRIPEGGTVAPPAPASSQLPGQQPQAPPAGTPQQQPSKVIPRAQWQEILQALSTKGLTPEQARKQYRDLGYTIEE